MQGYPAEIILKDKAKALSIEILFVLINIIEKDKQELKNMFEYKAGNKTKRMIFL